MIFYRVTKSYKTDWQSGYEIARASPRFNIVNKNGVTEPWKGIHIALDHLTQIGEEVTLQGRWSTWEEPLPSRASEVKGASATFGTAA